MKKAQITQKYLIGIVLLGAFLIIAVMFAKKVFDATKKEMDLSECEQTILSHTNSLKLTDKRYAPPIICPTIEETLKTKDEEKIKFELAERMRKCWKAWQEGKAELFIEEATYCHPCYIIDFKHEVKIEEFNRFLIKMQVPNQDYTYTQYLSGYTNNPDFKADEIADNPSIAENDNDFSTKNRKMVLLYYIKDSDLIKDIIDSIGDVTEGVAIGTMGGAIGGGIIGGVICGFFSFGTAAAPCAVLGAKIGGVVGGLAGGIIAGIAGDEDYPLWLSMVILRDFKGEKLTELGCDITPAIQSNTNN